MDNALITVIVVNYNSADFLKLGLTALEKLSLNRYKVIITDNGSCHDDLSILEKFISTRPNIFLHRHRQGDLAPSMAHGKALDFMLSKVDTPYLVVLDADATFLLKGWDQVMIKKLHGDIVAYGTPIVSESSKPKDFPLMFATMYLTEVLHENNCTFSPIEGMEGQGRDTGWMIRENLSKAGYKGANFGQIHTRYDHTSEFGKLICAAYYDDDGRLIASHYGRGSSLGEAKFLRGIPIPFVGRWLRRMIGKFQKKLWINICYRIMESQ